MAYKGDWRWLEVSSTTEQKAEPIYGTADEESSGEVQIIIGWDRRYRQITTKVRMETFTGENDFTPSIEPPQIGVLVRIGDEYRMTQKETYSGEHTETYQNVGSWTSF